VDIDSRHGGSLWRTQSGAPSTNGESAKTRARDNHRFNARSHHAIERPIREIAPFTLRGARLGGVVSGLSASCLVYERLASTEWVVSMALYDDGRAVLDEDGVTLRRYYFPAGTAKRIPYQRIRRAWAQPMGWATGKGRGWGTAHPRYWLPLDGSRPRKDTLVVLDVGGFVRPAFSPDDPERVMGLLRERTQVTSGPEG
jgi:hypothetical protein